MMCPRRFSIFFIFFSFFSFSFLDALFFLDISQIFTKGLGRNQQTDRSTDSDSDVMMRFDDTKQCPIQWETIILYSSILTKALRTNGPNNQRTNKTTDKHTSKNNMRGSQSTSNFEISFGSSKAVYTARVAPSKPKRITGHRPTDRPSTHRRTDTVSYRVTKN